MPLSEPSSSIKKARITLATIDHWTETVSIVSKVLMAYLQQIVLVPDTKLSQYWTMLYLCPNSFEQYEKDDPGIERSETMSAAIKDKDAAGGLEIMIEFTMRMVIERWEQIIGGYFAW